MQAERISVREQMVGAAASWPAGASQRSASGRPFASLLDTRLVVLAMELAVLTSSFDIALVFSVAGYTVRASQIALLPVVALGLGEFFARRQWPAGGGWLIAWAVVQFLFMFNSSSLSNAVGYELWLVFDALTIFGFAHVFTEQQEFDAFVRFYLNTFFFMALVGLVQFALYPLGINFFVEQRWTSRLARINGFSYEPSYYATYMLIGFVTHAYLLEKRSYGIADKAMLQRNVVFILVAIILSSSRMGWLMLGIWAALRVALAASRAMGRRGIGAQPFGIPHSLVIAVALAACVCVVVFGAIKPDLSMFGAGLGLFGSTTTHSFSDRLEGLQQCVAIFLESPLFGYSLGGVDPAIADLNGLTYDSSMNGSAMSILGELLVANGLVGLIPFIGFFAVVLSTFRGVGLDRGDSRFVLHRALVWALVFELAILCLNQNILRTYLWLHIAIVVASWNLCRGKGSAVATERQAGRHGGKACASVR